MRCMEEHVKMIWRNELKRFKESVVLTKIKKLESSFYYGCIIGKK